MHMKRRDFIINTSLISLGSLSLGLHANSPQRDIHTAADMQDYLRGLHEVGEPSVDRIVIGNPLTKISKVGTCWQPYFSTLRKAKEQEINLMIVHEPTFYAHWDLDGKDEMFVSTPSPAKEKYVEAVENKKRWIEENEMVIIRSHDVPDILKGFGIPFALGLALGYENKDIVRSKDYYNVYQVAPDSAWNVAQNIANKLMVLNQPGVAFYGDQDRMVSTVGLGTGCICDPTQYQELNPDLVIAIDDTVRTWTQTSYAEDTGDPLVVINHGTAEEMGMRLLNQHLSQNIPDIEFIHLNQGCTYRWIPGT
ncbi:MAG: NGG1p interacting factor NIF3 [Bacteroidetes bacterium]|nr:MAG: NGG1p interacting factor NIF3 [Bacteroidota bacterium]RLD90477.1 MAG: NGG1p interacting factor NIF3 [Bacteroidota bacterium]